MFEVITAQAPDLPFPQMLKKQKKNKLNYDLREEKNTSWLKAKLQWLSVAHDISEMPNRGKVVWQKM